MTYVYKDAVYINSDQTRINCWLDLPEHEGWTPYTLDINDPDMTIDNTVLLDQMQTDGAISEYVPPTPPTQEEIDAESALTIRQQRSDLLAAFVDPVVSNPMRWDSLTPDEKTEVTQYRTDLLNVTDQDTFPTSVTWPTQPSVLDVS